MTYILESPGRVLEFIVSFVILKTTNHKGLIESQKRGVTLSGCTMHCTITLFGTPVLDG